MAPMKGTLSAAQATEAVANALRRRGHDVVEKPLPDGGEGTANVLGHAWQLTEKAFTIEGCIRHMTDGSCPVSAWIRGSRAVVESASVVGIWDAPRPLTPLAWDTRALGYLLQAVIDDGASDVFVGLGGSATVDGGAGLLRVLPALPLGVRLTGLVDVMAPLGGPRGARAFFAQKGVPPDRFDDVEATLCALHPHFVDVPGAGAAGGLGAAVLALAGVVSSGADVVFDASAVDEAIAGADVVIAGEGCVDATTLMGKSVARVQKSARAHAARFVVVCGRYELDSAVGDAFADDVVTLGDRGLRDAVGAIDDAIAGVALWSYVSMPSGSTTQSCRRAAYTCTVGGGKALSAKAPTGTATTSASSTMTQKTVAPQAGQNEKSMAEPSSPTRR